MHPKGRYNIKIAQRENIEIKTYDNVESIPIFIEMYRKTAERHNFKAQENIYVETLLKILFATKQGRLFFAEKNGTLLAGAVVINYGSTATYFIGASTNESPKSMASYLLHWEIMRSAKNAGCSWYDLWGISGTPNDSWGGITEFKRKFGGTQKNFIGAYDLIF